MIVAQDLVRRLAGLHDIGTGPGGVNRLAWTPEDAQSGEWFAEQAGALGLRVERDAAGNRWALPSGDGPWWGVGSHLDSVRDGGRLDGPLGVVAAFAVAARSPWPVAVVSFADEEGARFNTPTFGSRALAGRLDVADAMERVDDDGVTLADAMRGAGVDPGGLAAAPAALGRLRGFLELHIDQSRDLDRAGAPVGVVSGLAARLRLVATITGQADHAGTTPPDERADALLAAARLAVAVHDLSPGGAAPGGSSSAAEATSAGGFSSAAAGGNPSALDGVPSVRATATRILTEPNAATAIAGRVRLWIDARSAEAGPLDAFETDLRGRAEEIAAEGGVSIDLAVSARSPAVAFDPAVRAALSSAAPDAPELTCFAGHDAGVLAGAGVPAGMVLVRNPTGVSHAPDEDVSPDDAAAGATALLGALEELHR